MLVNYCKVEIYYLIKVFSIKRVMNKSFNEQNYYII